MGVRIGLRAWVQPLMRMVMLFGTLWSMVSIISFLLPRKAVLAFAGAGALPDAVGGMGMSSLEGQSYVLSEDIGEAEELLLEGLPEPDVFSRPLPLLYSAYKVVSGDTISELAISFGLNQDTLISVNGISNTRLLQIGQVLKVPNQDGIFHTVASGDTLAALAERYRVEAVAVQTANELFSEQIAAGFGLFIPGAKMDSTLLQEINGDLFMWPLRGYRGISSYYGSRIDPFGSGSRQFHTGIDIPAPLGTPVYAAMAGRVSVVDYNATNGNYIVITHYSGYRSLYAHLSVVRVKAGTYVQTGTRIGDVGTTGLSTGYHLHFTVYKDGYTVNPLVYTH